MTVVVLSLATALAYGASDYLGGLASRRGGSSLGVVALFKLVVLAVLAASVSLSGEAPVAGATAWGAMAGLAIAAGYLVYFRGLAVGRMGVVATVAAVWSAVVPLGIDLALGERPTPLAWGGIVAIVVAIPLITYARRPDLDGHGRTERGPSAGSGPIVARLRASGVFEGTGAGIGFGLFFVALGQAGRSGGTPAWPLLASAACAAILVGMVGLLKRVAWHAALRQWPAIVGAGATYAGGSWAFIAAASHGWLSIPAVLAALSPAPTMLLAWLLLCEALSARQLVGVAVALAGVALVTLGLPV